VGRDISAIIVANINVKYGVDMSVSKFLNRIHKSNRYFTNTPSSTSLAVGL